MRKLLLVIGALLVAHIALLFVRPSGAVEPSTSAGLDVGIVFDVGEANVRRRRASTSGDARPAVTGAVTVAPTGRGGRRCRGTP